METRVHRLERLLCYVLLVFVGLFHLIHGSLSSNDSRGTSRSRSNTTTHSSRSNASSSRGTSSGGDGGSIKNNSKSSRRSNISNININRINNNGENDFRTAFVGQILSTHRPPQRLLRVPPVPLHPHSHHHQQQYKDLADNGTLLRLKDKQGLTPVDIENKHLSIHPPPQHRLQQPPVPLHHHHQQQQQQQQYKDSVDNGTLHHREDQRGMLTPINITHFSTMSHDLNLTSKLRGQILKDVISDNNDRNRTAARVMIGKSKNIRGLLWLYHDTGDSRQVRRQHVAKGQRNRRQAPPYTKADKTSRKVYFNGTHEISNSTGVKINIQSYSKDKNNKKDPYYFLYNATKESKNSGQARPSMRPSDHANRAESWESRQLSFKPPTQLLFVKKPPSYDISETGQTLTYECEVDTSNLTVDPEIYWTIPDRITKERKGPEDLYPGEFRHDIYVDDNHTLIIKNVQMKHRGMYICVVSVGQITEMVTMVLRVMRVSGIDLFVRLIVGFSIAFVVIITFGSIWMARRVINNRKSREEEENGPSETTEIRRTTPDVHYFL